MREIESIVEFAIPPDQRLVAGGSEIYELVEAQCEIAPVGVTPLVREGYMFA